MNWVTIEKFSEKSGYSKDAIEAKRKKGHWKINEQVRKAPDGRIFIGIKEVEKWIKS